jgi:maleate isomerase
MPDTASQSAPPLVNRTQMAHRFDDGISERARLGLIVLATDYTIEWEWRQIMTPLAGVGLYHARIMNSASITPETLAAMEGDLASTTRLLLPGSPFDVLAYGCTSASMVIGEQRVSELLQSVRPEAKVTTPVTAARAAFQALGVRRIALLTPYIQEINDRLRGYFESRGIPVPVMGSYNIQDDTQVAKLSRESVMSAAIELGRNAAVDGVFVSCTSIRLVNVVEELEQKLGKPVTSSNHAMAWHTLRLAGIDEKLEGFGSLFRA